MDLNIQSSELIKDPTWEFLNIYRVQDDKTSEIVDSWWDAWDGTGWKKIWKQFLVLIHDEYIKLSDEDKKYFEITDTKSKYGSLRVNVSSSTDKILKLRQELVHISTFTCEKCGKQSTNKNNEHIIWTSNSDWIINLCKECAIFDCSETSLDECFMEICDHNKITLESYKEEEKTWNPWINYNSSK